MNISYPCRNHISDMQKWPLALSSRSLPDENREGTEGSATVSDCACLIKAMLFIGRLVNSNVLRVVDHILTFASYVCIKLFNYKFIKIVNSLEYFYWKKYSLFCHIAELGTLYTSMGLFASCFIATHSSAFVICRPWLGHIFRILSLRMPQYKNLFEISGILFLSIY